MSSKSSSFNILAYNTNLTQKSRTAKPAPASASVAVPDFFSPASANQPSTSALPPAADSAFCLLIPEADRQRLHLSALTQSLAEKFETPTAVQGKVVPLFFSEERDLNVIAPTGSGKTLAYLLGIMRYIIESKSKKVTKAVVILPTRELARQVFSVFVPLLALLLPRRKVSIQLLNKSTVNSVVDSPPEIVISVPSDLLLRLDTGDVKVLILDEWDRLQDAQFGDVLDQFLPKFPETTRRAMFSATRANRKHDEEDKSKRQEPITVSVKLPKADRHKVDHRLVFSGSEEGKLLSFSSLVSESKLKPPTLIFVQSTERANALFIQLSLNVNLRVDVIHAALSNAARDTAIDRFLSGQTWVLITTDLLARGIDFQGVFQVINFDLPADPSAYLHRAGRTGRAGRGGEVITYFTKSDARDGRLKTIANVLKNAGVEIPEFISNLRTISHGEKQKLRHSAAKRSEIGGYAARIGKQEGRKRKEIVLASKRRKILKEKIEKSDKAEST